MYICICMYEHTLQSSQVLPGHHEEWRLPTSLHLLTSRCMRKTLLNEPRPEPGSLETLVGKMPGTCRKGSNFWRHAGTAIS